MAEEKGDRLRFFKIGRRKWAVVLEEEEE